MSTVAATAPPARKKPKTTAATTVTSPKKRAAAAKPSSSSGKKKALATSPANMQDEKEDEKTMQSVQQSRENRRRSRKTATATTVPVEEPTDPVESSAFAAFSDFSPGLTRAARMALYTIHKPMDCKNIPSTPTEFIMHGFMRQGAPSLEDEPTDEARTREQLCQDVFDYVSFASPQPPYFIDMASRAREYLKRAAPTASDDTQTESKTKQNTFHVLDPHNPFLSSMLLTRLNVKMPSGDFPRLGADVWNSKVAGTLSYYGNKATLELGLKHKTVSTCRTLLTLAEQVYRMRLTGSPARAEDEKVMAVYIPQPMVLSVPVPNLNQLELLIHTARAEKKARHSLDDGDGEEVEDEDEDEKDEDGDERPKAPKKKKKKAPKKKAKDDNDAARLMQREQKDIRKAAQNIINMKNAGTQQYGPFQPRNAWCEVSRIVNGLRKIALDATESEATATESRRSPNLTLAEAAILNQMAQCTLMDMCTGVRTFYSAHSDSHSSATGQRGDPFVVAGSAQYAYLIGILTHPSLSLAQKEFFNPLFMETKKKKSNLQVVFDPEAEEAEEVEAEDETKKTAPVPSKRQKTLAASSSSSSAMQLYEDAEEQDTTQSVEGLSIETVTPSKVKNKEGAKATSVFQASALTAMGVTITENVLFKKPATKNAKKTQDKTEWEKSSYEYLNAFILSLTVLQQQPKQFAEVEKIFEGLYGEGFAERVRYVHEVFFKRMHVKLPTRMFPLREVRVELQEGDVLYVNDRSLLGMTPHLCKEEQQCSGFQLFVQAHYQKVASGHPAIALLHQQRELECKWMNTPTRTLIQWDASPNAALGFFHESDRLTRSEDRNGGGGGDAKHPGRFGNRRTDTSKRAGKASPSKRDTSAMNSRQRHQLEDVGKMMKEMDRIGRQQVTQSSITPKSVIDEGDVERMLFVELCKLWNSSGGGGGGGGGSRRHASSASNDVASSSSSLIPARTAPDDMPPLLKHRWCYAELPHPEQKLVFLYDLERRCKYAHHHYVSDMPAGEIEASRREMKEVIETTERELQESGCTVMSESNDVRLPRDTLFYLALGSRKRRGLKIALGLK